MTTKRILRYISLVMLLIAIVFVCFALSHPEMGTTFYIGNLKIGSDIWKIFYIVYIAIMASLFVLSFRKK